MRDRRAGPVQRQDENERRFYAGLAVDPSPRIRLEDGSDDLSARALDLVSPIGMGQRGYIVAPPGSGKTTFLKRICNAVVKSRPEVKLYCLLVNERPEEVTDFKRSVPAEVRASSSDETYEHHVRMADDLMRQAVREAGAGANVMVVIDSLTRLARVHNAERRSTGRTLSGGVDAGALEVPRRIFGAARKIEDGGSLTILATVLVETGSRMDDVIFEIAGRRIFPAIDIARSGTRKEELLMEPGELEPVRKLRRILSSMQPPEAAQQLVNELQHYPTNKEFLAAVAKA
jgi:transcription termination factor Rho